MCSVDSWPPERYIPTASVSIKFDWHSQTRPWNNYRVAVLCRMVVFEGHMKIVIIHSLSDECNMKEVHGPGMVE